MLAISARRKENKQEQIRLTAHTIKMNKNE
jgi:hypothetical protein